MSQQRTDGVVCKTMTAMALGTGVLLLAACSSTPPPRPLPEPKSQASRQVSGQSSGQRATDERAREEAATRTAQADPPASTPTTPTTPDWFRQGAFQIDGREHRAFAVTAAGVRQARGRAMALAYERYPRGHVAAHEAVRQGDGRWRFFVLMAAGG
ncbi:MAG: hypothetical protein ACIAS6_13165 [Phycisphaerales bacterium JB060]